MFHPSNVPFHVCVSFENLRRMFFGRPTCRRGIRSFAWMKWVEYVREYVREGASSAALAATKRPSFASFFRALPGLPCSLAQSTASAILTMVWGEPPPNLSDLLALSRRGQIVHLERRLRIDHRILVCVSIDVCATFTDKPYMRRRRIVVVGIRSYRFAISSNYLCTRTADARHCKYTYLQHSMARWLFWHIYIICICIYIYIFFFFLVTRSS